MIMISRDDIIKLSNVFATKEDLTDAVAGLETKEDATEKHDRVMNGMDRVLKELIAMREGQAVHELKHEEIETRLTDIEKVPVIASELRKKKS